MHLESDPQSCPHERRTTEPSSMPASKPCLGTSSAKPRNQISARIQRCHDRRSMTKSAVCTASILSYKDSGGQLLSVGHSRIVPAYCCWVKRQKTTHVHVHAFESWHAAADAGEGYPCRHCTAERSSHNYLAALIFRSSACARHTLSLSLCNNSHFGTCFGSNPNPIV